MGERVTGSRGRGPRRVQRRFEGSAPPRGSRVSISHRHCLASSLGCSERPSEVGSHGGHNAERATRDRPTSYLVRELRARYRKRDSLKHETRLYASKRRCRAVCREPAAAPRKYIFLLQLHVSLICLHLIEIKHLAFTTARRNGSIFEKC